MNITLGSGNKIHSSTHGLNTPDCNGWGHKASERYRATTQEVTCARCIKKLAAQQPTPQDETTPAVPTSEDLAYGTATAPCRECRQPARYTIDGIHWCERHRGLADIGTNTPPHLPGDGDTWGGYENIRDNIDRQNAERLASGPSIIRTVLDRVAETDGDPTPTPTDDVPTTTKNVTMQTFAGTRKVHAPNGTGDAPRCQPYNGNGSRRWTTTDRAVDCRTCLGDECNTHGHITRATPGNPLDTCDRCGTDLEPTPTDDVTTV